ncbi:hypothetical protein N7456_006237 [Penicillium angulare]|uniref:WD40 repeat-like protein n=1 Tax=Penicillium angulare TaxID=116970 RepID=A0A9W9KBH5_9EURO|nr:hypothetical protein N7456_006237 [Penicillium angulare]
MSLLNTNREDEIRTFSQSPPYEAGINGPRRSGRSRNTPVTYNVRVLTGLARDESKARDEPPNWPYEQEPPSRVCDSSSILVNSPPVPATPQATPRATPNLQNLLWNREMHGRNPSRKIHAEVTSNFRPWKSWKGASNDVVALAWSPDGTKFAAGASAHSDEYNRKYNLLLGGLVDGTLHELPDHWTRRPSLSVATDERLYSSVTSMQWAGDRLYTASYDNTVKIWDVGGHEHPPCLRTLKHDSKVVVMGLSKSMPNLIATGTNQFRLWNVQEGREPTWNKLDILRDPRQKAVELVPTALAWGHTAQTKHFLVGGMAERVHDEYKVPQCGHLGMWEIGESSITPRKLSPDSQNVFDIKWHHSLPKFVAATTYSQAMHLPYRTRTVVQVYDCKTNDIKVTSRFSCTAADINETEFCPMDSSYISASCTDGKSYVWDVRKPDKAVHRLSHGTPLQPLTHEYSREFTDYGVSVALWGATIDQFYTGGSDGFVKQWDIRRSPEDVLVSNVASFDEGITSGAFSADKSHILIGAHGGAIRVLSCGPSDPENGGFKLKDAHGPAAPELSGREASNVLLANAEIERHPIYGPGQGPNYKGPYARWARGLNDETSLEDTINVPLEDEVLMQQLDAPHVQSPVVDPSILHDLQMRRRLVQVRNALLGPARQQVALPSNNTTVRVQRRSDRPPGYQRELKRKKYEDEDVFSREIKRFRQSDITEVIDLTLDSTEPPPTANVHDLTLHSASTSISTSELQSRLSPSPPLNLEELEQDYEDDYWWPDSGLYDANICDSD